MDGGNGYHVNTSKKIRRTTREPNGAIFMLRCAELGLSDSALNNMSMGMVFDMFTEKGNDEHKYPYQATQEDIYKFFGGCKHGGQN